MRQQPSPASIVLLYGVLIAMVVMVRRTRRHPAASSLPKGQRLRPIAVTWLDPVLVMVFVGTILWDLMSRSAWHVLAALVGAIVAVPIGIARANTQFVRPVREARAVVFRRSPLEYGLLGLLLVLRIIEDSINHLSSGTFTFLLTAIVSLGVVESIVRAAAITSKYYETDRRATDPPPGELEPPRFEGAED